MDGISWKKKAMALFAAENSCASEGWNSDSNIEMQ